MRSATDRLARIIPPLTAATPLDEHRKLIETTIGVSLRLTGMVHDDDPAETAKFYAGLPADQRAILPLVTAALVDVTRTARELLAWTGWQQPVRYDGATALSPASSLLGANPRPTRSRDCGSEGGWREHQRTGSKVCAHCLVAHDAHIRDERARARAARRKARIAASPVRLVAAYPTLPFAEGETNVA
jgi:hypothetical protein